MTFFERCTPSRRAPCGRAAGICIAFVFPVQYTDMGKGVKSMKLNPDCIRDVLLHLEEMPYRTSTSVPEITSNLKGFSNDEVMYTCLKLNEAGLIDATVRNYPSDGYDIVIRVKDITYSGHQFLETIRSPKSWKIIKKGCENVGSFALKTISSIAEGVATAAINQYLSGNLGNM